MIVLRNASELDLVAYSSNLSYRGGKDWEDLCLRPAGAKS
jgi:hypothetical protein